MAIIIPIKLANGKLISNFKELKEVLTKEEYYEDILQAIVYGDMERFLTQLGRKDLTKIIQDGKEDKKSHIEIANLLSKKLGPKFDSHRHISAKRAS